MPDIQEVSLALTMRREYAKCLQAKWDEGKASGPGEPLNFDDLRQEDRRLLKEARQQRGNAR